jgi:hypothetical protein
MRILGVLLIAALSASVSAEETIQNTLNTKTGPASVHVLRGSIKRKNGIACTVELLIANLADLTTLASSAFKQTIEVGTERYCENGVNIEKFLASFPASDVLIGNAKSQLFERIFVMPENQGGPGPQCVRQLVETLSITLPGGAVIEGPQGGFDFPGTPAMDICRGLRQ